MEINVIRVTLLSNFLGALPISNSAFGQGGGPIALNDVSCSGTEARLINCTSGVVRYCSHSMDAGVRCNNQTGNIGTIVTL